MTPAEKAAALKARIAKMDHAFRGCFAGTDGDKVIADLKHQFRYHSTTIVKDDPYGTFANEGARQVVLYILKRLERAENNSEGMDE